MADLKKVIEEARAAGITSGYKVPGFRDFEFADRLALVRAFESAGERLMTELAKFRREWKSNIRMMRPQLYGADDNMREDVVALEAFRATITGGDWSQDALDQAAEYCGVKASKETVVRMFASRFYRESTR